MHPASLILHPASCIIFNSTFSIPYSIFDIHPFNPSTNVKHLLSRDLSRLHQAVHPRLFHRPIFHGRRYPGRHHRPLRHQRHRAFKQNLPAIFHHQTKDICRLYTHRLLRPLHPKHHRGSHGPRIRAERPRLLGFHC